MPELSHSERQAQRRPALRRPPVTRPVDGRLLRSEDLGLTVAGAAPFTELAYMTGTRDLPVRVTVDTSELVLFTTQDTIAARRVREYQKSRDYRWAWPEVVEYQGDYWVRDGHHRIAAALANGEGTLTLSVTRLH